MPSSASLTRGCAISHTVNGTAVADAAEEVTNMAEKKTEAESQGPARQSSRSEDELDREPASNRGRKGQTRASRRVARSEEEGLDPAAAQDDLERDSRSNN
jgi:hypothetical protein